MTMNNEIITQMRVLLDQLESGGGAAGPLARQPEPDTGQDIRDYLSADYRTFVKDYWIVGRVSAAAGTVKNHYDNGMTLMRMMLGGTGIPFHISVFKPAPVGAAWSAAISNAADIGWIDGSRYQPTNPPGQNFASWVVAGCPTVNQYGRFDQRGDLIDMNAEHPPVFGPLPKP
jgi:hypothetical protein